MLVEAGYICGECDEFWEWQSEAEDCCQPEPQPAYKCTGCFEVYEEELDAEYCCHEIDNDCA